jgi:hypothetical protein
MSVSPGIGTYFRFDSQESTGSYLSDALDMMPRTEESFNWHVMDPSDILLEF